MVVRPIDANVAMKKICEYMEDFPNAHTRLTACRAILSMLGDENQMPTLTPPNEPERAGLYGKYTVYKNKDGSLVPDCFVLRPAKDPAAVIALRAYAAATENAELSADIINWVGAEPNEPLTLEELREMDGEPVWVTPLGFWALVIAKPGERVRLMSNDGETVWADKEIELVGPVYRRPPEGEVDA